MRFFVKLPPNGDCILDKPKKGEWDPCTSANGQEYGRTTTEIEYCEVMFAETSNPLYVINAFILAMKAGLYPPLWAMNYVTDSFIRAANNGFHVGRAFGFEREGKGRWTTPVQQNVFTRRNKEICLLVFKFEALGLSRSAACDAAASMMLNTDGEEELSAAGVRKILRDVEQNYEAEKRVIQKAAKFWTEEEKRGLLSRVDRESLPKKIREALRL